MAKIWRIALCAPLFMLTAQTAEQPAEAPIAGDFCARLAKNIGVNKPAAPDGRTTWTINALNFGQRFIFGGAAATGVSVDPINPTTVEDYQKLTGMCMPGVKGAICKLAGPVNFNFVWKGQRIITPMAAGERATISVLGTQTTCGSETP